MTDALAHFDDDVRTRRGVRQIGGIDEAGRGALAGPVVAACVVLDRGTRLPGVDDSKRLTPAQRERLVAPILETAAGWGMGWATAAEVDRLNVLQATHLAARRALHSLRGAAPQWLLTDFLALGDTAPCPCEPLVDGDARSLAIAAASILAKVARDRIMTALAAAYPGYGFERHKGYGTAEHRDRLARLGPSPLHRMTFQGVGFFHALPAVGADRSLPGDPPAWDVVLRGSAEAWMSRAWMAGGATGDAPAG